MRSQSAGGVPPAGSAAARAAAPPTLRLARSAGGAPHPDSSPLASPSSSQPSSPAGTRLVALPCARAAHGVTYQRISSPSRKPAGPGVPQPSNVGGGGQDGRAAQPLGPKQRLPMVLMDGGRLLPLSSSSPLFGVAAAAAAAVGVGIPPRNQSDGGCATGGPLAGSEDVSEPSAQDLAPGGRAGGAAWHNGASRGSSANGGGEAEGARRRQQPQQPGESIDLVVGLGSLRGSLAGGDGGPLARLGGGSEAGSHRDFELWQRVLEPRAGQDSASVGGTLGSPTAASLRGSWDGRSQDAGRYGAAGSAAGSVARSQAWSEGGGGWSMGGADGSVSSGQSQSQAQARRGSGGGSRGTAAVGKHHHVVHGLAYGPESGADSDEEDEEEERGGRQVESPGLEPELEGMEPDGPVVHASGSGSQASSPTTPEAGGRRFFGRSSSQRSNGGGETRSRLANTTLGNPTLAAGELEEEEEEEREVVAAERVASVQDAPSIGAQGSGRLLTKTSSGESGSTTSSGQLGHFTDRRPKPLVINPSANNAASSSSQLGAVIHLPPSPLRIRTSGSGAAAQVSPGARGAGGQAAYRGGSAAGPFAAVAGGSPSAPSHGGARHQPASPGGGSGTWTPTRTPSAGVRSPGGSAFPSTLNSPSVLRPPKGFSLKQQLTSVVSSLLFSSDEEEGAGGKEGGVTS